MGPVDTLRRASLHLDAATANLSEAYVEDGDVAADRDVWRLQWRLGEAVTLAGEYLSLNASRTRDALAAACRALRAARKAYGR